MDAGKDVIIRRNNVVNDHGYTSATMTDNYFGPIDNVLVENNRLIGGGFPIYCDGQFNQQSDHQCPLHQQSAGQRAVGVHLLPEHEPGVHRECG